MLWYPYCPANLSIWPWWSDQQCWLWWWGRVLRCSRQAEAAWPLAAAASSPLIHWSSQGLLLPALIETRPRGPTHPPAHIGRSQSIATKMCPLEQHWKWMSLEGTSAAVAGRFTLSVLISWESRGSSHLSQDLLYRTTKPSRVPKA